MRIFGLLTIALATVPVLALAASPKSGEPVLAVFGDDLPMPDILSRVQDSGLDIIGYDEALRHVIIQDQNGRSATRLYQIGARLVIDPGLFSCQPIAYTPV